MTHPEGPVMGDWIEWTLLGMGAATFIVGGVGALAFLAMWSIDTFAKAFNFTPLFLRWYA